MSEKYALIIGNTEYSDPGLTQLTAPGKDAEDFARVLKDKEICGFDEVNLLLNQPEYIVRRSIDEFFDQKKPDDLLLLYFSGHGVRDDLGSLYLAVKNTIRGRLRSTAIKSDYIREAMEHSRSKRQVLILDCCNSGAFEPGTKAATGVSIGTASAFEAGYGRIILTASDSTQFAWEGDKVIGETDNSLFTHFLVEGLGGEADLNGDGRITIDELYDYTYDKVKLVTPKQTPSKFSSKQQGEIVLRQIARIQDIKPLSLPPELLDALEDSRTFVRESAVQQLAKILAGRNLGMARSAREALERIEKEDDSRRVSQAATQILKPVRQVEQKAQEEQKAHDVPEQLTTRKAEDVGTIREQVEAERRSTEAFQKLMREQAKPESAPFVNQKAMEKAIQQTAENNVDREKTTLGQILANVESGWNTILNDVRTIPRNKLWIYIPVGVVALVMFATGFVFYRQLTSPSLYFPAISEGQIDLYLFNGRNTTKVYSAIEGVEYGSFATGPFEKMYFTRSEAGKSEIWEYKKSEGAINRLTFTPDQAESWAPAVSALGKLFFTSNRTGKAEIYEFMTNGQVQQLTNTPGQAESWAPAVSAFGKLFFTSNRSGKAEIYELLNDGEVRQLTDTPGEAESWSPAAGTFGRLFFTSNRSGKAEIYELKSNGDVLRFTDTPGQAESWSPISRGNRVYFTSNRGGSIGIYSLSEFVSITPFESWTSRSDETLLDLHPK